MKKIVVSILLLFVILISTNQLNAGDGNKEPVITEVHVVFGANPLIDDITLNIFGTDLCAIDPITFTCNPLSAKLREVDLAIVSFDSTMVVATTPVMPDGDYLLEIDTGDEDITFDLTLGAVGPQGPQGEQGIAGANGAVGPAGPTGSTGSDGPPGLPGSANISGTTNSIIKFTGSTAGGDSIIFDNGINVGIGTKVPSSTLQLGQDGVDANLSIYTGSGGIGGTSAIKILKEEASGNFYTIGIENDALEFRGNLTRWGGRIRLADGMTLALGYNESIEFGDVPGTFGTTAQITHGGLDNFTGRLIFKTRQAGIMTEVLRLDEIGNVGIGMSTPLYPLHMGSGAHVTIGGVWTNASSRTFKENIADLTMEQALEALNQLNPVTYNYKAEKDETYVGFIAEDVPEIAAMNDRKSLSPMDIVAILTKVVREQQAEIAEIKAKLQ